ncbi:MAG: peptidoglycan bridge formation glycyltransferase FemA/FemB family protein [Anaerolineae bacterium]|nr:peptidoglycan bridge formation glycyltransferase FemA/FemB family protein [Anaerolineae bacterium]
MTALAEPLLRAMSAPSEVVYDISTRLEDPEWDAFLAMLPAGRHIQSSRWARFKAHFGWESFRVLARQDGGIVGGVQALVRPVRWLGRLGYVAHGPALFGDDPALIAGLLESLECASRLAGLRYLVVQPPPGGESLVEALLLRAYAPCPADVAPTATTTLDLTAGVEPLLARMKRQTRQNIQRSQRQGVVVRRATLKDLDSFYDLYSATSRRQEFTPYPKRYFTELWHLLAPEEAIQVFIGSHEGCDLAGLLTLNFGGRVHAKVCGWSGAQPECRPNEAVFWAAVQWAVSAGYRWFDFDGFDRQIALMVCSGVEPPEWWHHTASFFKHGFGGQLAIYPTAYHFVFSPPLRFAVNRLALPVITGHSTLHRIPPVRTLSDAMIRRLADAQRTVV